MKFQKGINLKLLFSGMTTIVLIMLTAFSSRLAAQNHNVVVNMDNLKQEIRGFGAANIVGWRPDMTETDIENAFGTDEGQLGFSVLRLRIPPNENQWGSRG